MRLLVKLCSLEDSKYEMEYHHNVQGLIYNFLRGSDFDNHDKHGYKFFSFSNIFPFYDLKKGDVRNLLISSPSEDFISYVKEQLDYIHQIRIGQMKFRIDRSNKFLVNPETTLITSTPILSRIYRDRYEEIGAQEFVNGHDAYYWRSNHPVQLFITQLENNLIKKYNQYHGLGDVEISEPIFHKFRFLRQLSTRLIFGMDKTHKVIGSTWEFDCKSSPLIQFALDTGLGELNSLGFGFMNVKRGDRENCNN